MVSFSFIPNPQAGGPPLVGCPRLLIQYNLQLLEAISSVRNLRMCHAMVARDTPYTGLMYKSSEANGKKFHENCSLSVY
jgi:hypothetical protein